MHRKERAPEVEELGQFLTSLNKESDRGAALIAASMLDYRLQRILAAFFVESKASHELLDGFNAPLGTFSSRASAARALALIQENEFKEITLLRNIRNKFGHGWRSLTFESFGIAELCRELPWLGPEELEIKSGLRQRFNFAITVLLTDLLWRERLVANERRVTRQWSNKARHG